MKKKLHSTKNKINKVALDLFIKKGIKGTTTKEIAKKAKIAEGTIYKYFPSKDTIAIELFKKYMGEFNEKLLENSKNSTDPTAKLKMIIEAFFDFAKNEPKACFYIVIGHYTELNKLSKEKNKLKDIFASVIKEGIKQGIFRKIDENLGAALIIGMINRSILFYQQKLIDTNYKKLTSETTKAALRILKKPAE